MNYLTNLTYTYNPSTVPAGKVILKRTKCQNAHNENVQFLAKERKLATDKQIHILKKAYAESEIQIHNKVK